MKKFLSVVMLVFVICILNGIINAPIVSADNADKVKIYTEKIRQNPNDVEAYYNRGVAYYDLENYSQAIFDFSQVIKLNKNYSDAYYNRGLSYLCLENYQQAIDDFSKYIQLNPYNADGYVARGACYYKLGQEAKKEKDFAKARELGWDG